MMTLLYEVFLRLTILVVVQLWARLQLRCRIEGRLPGRETPQ
jgi:hypothetical protein